MKNFFLISAGVVLLLLYSSAFSQSKRVAITIDDIPFQGKNSIPLEATWKTNIDLLSGIHKEHTPVAAFFTGRQCHTVDGMPFDILPHSIQPMVSGDVIRFSIASKLVRKRSISPGIFLNSRSAL